MPELVVPGPVNQDRTIREAVCIHTRKIFDSCKSKECIEDLRVYPCRSSQEILDRAASVKARDAQLLYACLDVEPVNFNRGFYTVDVRYFYRITAEACVGASRPLEITGLAVYDKRAILFGGDGNAKVFSSPLTSFGCSDVQQPSSSNLPTAVVEAVDPLVLGMRLVDVCDCRPGDCGTIDIPPSVAACFPDPLVSGGDAHRLYITLGQFSIVRLERDTQLLIPVYDYCMPEKECSCGNGEDCQRDPCELFREVQFPVSEFFPSSTIPPRGENGYQSLHSSCGC